MLDIDQVSIMQGQHQFTYHRSIHVGNIVTLQGRSGVGKSTLLMAIAGFLSVESGDIRWQGASLLTKKVEQRPISFLFQEHNLFEHITVLENLTLGLKQQERRKYFFWFQKNKQSSNKNKGCLHEIEAAAEQLQVSDLLKRLPSELSGGQRQRIALMRTLLRPEPIVLLDEPFAELDQHTRAIASAWLVEKAKQYKKTVILVTHQQEDVSRLADENWTLG